MRVSRISKNRVRLGVGVLALSGAILAIFAIQLAGVAHSARTATGRAVVPPVQRSRQGQARHSANAPEPAGLIQAVGAESFYADVIRQIGDGHVNALSIINNPSADPHSYEPGTGDAAAVAGSGLVVQNGLGYDAFMNKLEAASPNTGRAVIEVGAALGYKLGANPHLWYNPTTMPRVAALIATALARRDPANRAFYQANLRRFDAALTSWTGRIAALRRRFAGTPVAVTEPVFDYAAAAMGLHILTPYSFQLAVMEGNDPAPQDAQAEQDLFTQRKIKVFIYNQQAVMPITTLLLGLARAHHIPVIGVYESMPLNEHYQDWMLAETAALDRALSQGISSERVP